MQQADPVGSQLQPVGVLLDMTLAQHHPVIGDQHAPQHCLDQRRQPIEPATEVVAVGVRHRRYAGQPRRPQRQYFANHAAAVRQVNVQDIGVPTQHQPRGAQHSVDTDDQPPPHGPTDERRHHRDADSFAGMCCHQGDYRSHTAPAGRPGRGS